jgi:hypothetical protein
MTMTRNPMNSRSMLGCRGYSFLALQLFLLTIIITTLGRASGQTPADLLTRLRSLPPEAQSNALHRFQYFYEQRAYPNQQIPPGAMQKARQELTKQFGPMTQPAFNQNLWTAIGPSQISTNPTTSGRTNTIAVDPTNPNIIYYLYRRCDWGGLEDHRRRYELGASHRYAVLGCDGLDRDRSHQSPCCLRRNWGRELLY